MENGYESLMVDRPRQNHLFAVNQKHAEFIAIALTSLSTSEGSFARVITHSVSMRSR